MRKAVAFLIVAAAVATPASARGVRTLPINDARVAAFEVAIHDAKTVPASPGGHWLTPTMSCSRKARTWVTCRIELGESQSQPVRKSCRRTVDVRLRAGRDRPVVTKHALSCSVK
jgi:hypothetical protein